MLFCLCLMAACGAGADTRQLTTAIRVGSIPSSARALLTAQGTRLTAPGKERLTIQAIVTDSKGSREVRLIWEAPGRFRYDDYSAGKTIAFDSRAVSSAVAGPSDTDLDMVETLLSDGAEAFFENFQNGAPFRFLGRGFRDDDGTNPGYTGPFHDIYHVMVPLTFTKTKASRWKMYYFDSRTRLLAKVRYLVSRNGASTDVTTVYSGWLKIDGEMVPGRIERSEGGKPALSFVNKGAAFGAAVGDSLFSKP
ncbi:MAG: hypothetical protein ABFD89_28960 [Bryobacteraceae bacterium]